MPINLKTPDFNIDWTLVADKITSRTKMIIINTPQKPTGSILTNSDLDNLDNLTRYTDILVLSDEVYQHLIYDDQRPESVLHYYNLFTRSIVTMSFGKTFHATGWRTGYIIAPEMITAEIRKVHQFNTFSINQPLQHALAEYLKDPKYYLSLPALFQSKRDLFQDAI